jgi:hypothetical protein
VSFGAGYGANELTLKRRVRDEFVRAVTWAVDRGLLTVNGERVNALGEGDEEPPHTSDDANSVLTEDQHGVP